MRVPFVLVALLLLLPATATGAHGASLFAWQSDALVEVTAEKNLGGFVIEEDVAFRATMWCSGAYRIVVRPAAEEGPAPPVLAEEVVAMATQGGPEQPLSHLEFECVGLSRIGYVDGTRLAAGKYEVVLAQAAAGASETGLLYSGQPALLFRLDGA